MPFPAFYAEVDWALDISGAKFNSVSIRGVPGELIRRDEETQILVSKSLLRGAGWEKLPLPAITRIQMESALLQQHERQVIVAGRKSKTFTEEMRGLEILRRAGAAI